MSSLYWIANFQWYGISNIQKSCVYKFFDEEFHVSELRILEIIMYHVIMYISNAMSHLYSDGGEDAEVALLHPNEDEPQVVEVIPSQLQSMRKILDIMRLYPKCNDNH